MSWFLQSLYLWDQFAAGGRAPHRANLPVLSRKRREHWDAAAAHARALEKVPGEHSGSGLSVRGEVSVTPLRPHAAPLARSWRHAPRRAARLARWPGHSRTRSPAHTHTRTHTQVRSRTGREQATLRVLRAGRGHVTVCPKGRLLQRCPSPEKGLRYSHTHTCISHTCISHTCISHTCRCTWHTRMTHTRNMHTSVHACAYAYLHIHRQSCIP